MNPVGLNLLTGDTSKIADFFILCVSPWLFRHRLFHRRLPFDSSHKLSHKSNDIKTEHSKLGKQNIFFF